MNLSLTNPGWMIYRVYLNGETVRNAIEADDERGYVVTTVVPSPLGDAKEDGRKSIQGLVQILPHTFGDPEPVARRLFDTEVSMLEKTMNISEPCEWGSLDSFTKRRYVVMAIEVMKLGARPPSTIRITVACGKTRQDNERGEPTGACVREEGHSGPCNHTQEICGRRSGGKGCILVRGHLGCCNYE